MQVDNSISCKDDILTILFPYMYNESEYKEIFDELNVLSRSLFGISINMLSVDINHFIGNNMHACDILYDNALESYANKNKCFLRRR